MHESDKKRHERGGNAETTCVSALISRLRKKLGDSAGIKAIYGGGYVLEI